jgi:hypothetical protein
MGQAARAQQPQVIGIPDYTLTRPTLDGDPQRPPRFRRAREPTSDTSRFGEIRNFDYKPAIGAGTTGFDSTGARRKRKAAVKGKTPPAAAATAQPATTATAEQTAPGPAPAAAPASPSAALRAARTQRPGTPKLADPAGVAVVPALVARRRPLPPDENPFAPLGIQVGSFLLRPALEVMRGYDTNAARTMPPENSWYWVVAPELQVNSNWARHELTANLRGNYTSYDSIPSINRPSVDGKVNGRVDVTTLTRIDLEGRFILGTDRPGSPNIQADLAWLPIFTTLGGTAGIGQRFNRFEVALKGGVDRTVYQASHFMDGSTESNDDRNYIQYSTVLRTSYEVTPGIKPFTEVGADTRRHDVIPDRFGYFRDSNGVSAKAGSTFEFSRKLTGEIAAGYLTRSYADPRLVRLSGVLVDASLIWTATALTTVRLTARTTADETTLAGVSGSFTREAALQVDHAFRRWLLATLKFSRATDDYEGSPRIDTRYLASAALVYMLNRDWQLKGEFREEWRTSNEPGNGFWSSVYLLCVRWQR